ncbi:NAD(+) diphosphatase [Maricaulis sp.]|uniref:NAD(+) diphosphatase n=1 Tax=Maricaulis sp. TaxID=1486257 RepID=UPI00260F4877|nr:NAD(+) diphosphatase [Maricaulis sp.]
MNDRALLTGQRPMVFAGAPLDRGEVLRRDEDRLAALIGGDEGWWLILRDGEPLLQPDGAVFWFRRSELDGLGLGPERIFLGHYKGTPCFAAQLAKDSPLPDGVEMLDARRAAMGLSPDEAAIYGQARSLLAWHGRHGFCAGCGTATQIRSGGARRVCPACHSEHYPRVDPVVIMLAVNGEECLLGRQAAWPPAMWSALAGFVEPAETLEEACARELKEEAGVTADMHAIRYVMGQPWPFPGSLMIGLVAPVSDAAITVDTHELETARWFHRDEVRAMLDGTHPDAAMPPSIAIARRLAELWVDGAI